ncbi:hypothetical protein T439DRAFT_324104 [Meredithblackwellia eburnea MCA 4105]
MLLKHLASAILGAHLITATPTPSNHGDLDTAHIPNLLRTLTKRQFTNSTSSPSSRSGSSASASIIRISGSATATGTSPSTTTTTRTGPTCNPSSDKAVYLGCELTGVAATIVNNPQCVSGLGGSAPCDRIGSLSQTCSTKTSNDEGAKCICTSDYLASLNSCTACTGASQIPPAFIQACANYGYSLGTSVSVSATSPSGGGATASARSAATLSTSRPPSRSSLVGVTVLVGLVLPFLVLLL